MRAILGSTVMIVVCAVTGAVLAQDAPLAYTKSLNADSGDSDKIWNPDEIERPQVKLDGTKSLTAEAEPSIHEFAIKVQEGEIVVSQLWDASCSSSLCPTKVVLKKSDGSIKMLNDGEMMPQLDIERDATGSFKSLAPNQVALSQR